ncbi:class I SAM-dependent methyltransferase [Roseomonas aeriglobus]|nr:class I SAM-dependent methyltransferase [Roseomonas aeriglobus]
MTPDLTSLIAHYEKCLARFGADHRGVDWPNAADLAVRFDVMLSIIDVPPSGPAVPSVLDLGCGPGLILDHIARTPGRPTIDYHGIDLSEHMVDAARNRWPDARFDVRDVIADPLPPLSVDYVIINGVLTLKTTLSRDAMIDFAKKLIRAAFAAARIGVVFNVMSRHVDWERDDLFHWSFDEVASFLTADVTRHIAFRSDYGLYELSAFAYRAPRRGAA